MIRFLIALWLAFGPITTLTSHAQAPATTLQRLDVEIWPDYDQPSVLVLLTGTLPANAADGATVTVPIPAGANINAVARVSDQGAMFADISFDDDSPGQLTLTTPDARFRVEYYVPYETDGDERRLTFTWQADLTIDQLEATVQQPALATGLRLSPSAANVTSGQDGLQYYNLAPQAVPAGESFTLEATYTMAGAQLSAEVLQQRSAGAPDAVASGGESISVPGTSFNWPVVIAALGGALLAAGTVWFVVSKRPTTKRAMKPRPARRLASRRASQPASQRQAGAARFCHECGQGVEPGDRFCRNCGTALKRAL